MKFKAFLITFAIFLLPHSTFAATSAQGVSFELASASSCASMTLDLGLFGENLSTETLKVTDELNQEIFSGSNTKTAFNANGVLSVQVTLPRAAGKNTGLLGISYHIGESEDTENQAGYFAVVDCAALKTAYSCFGKKNSCPNDMSEFFPKANFTKDDGEALKLGKIFAGDSSYNEEFVTLKNSGFLDLEIQSVSIEGPDASQFDLDTYGTVPFTLRQFGDADIYVFPKEKITAGKKSATLKIQTSDPFHPVYSFPLSMRVIFLPDLKVSMKDLKLSREGDRAVISGKAVIVNDGLVKSSPNAEFSVALFDINTPDPKCSSDEGCNPLYIYRRTIMKKKIGSIRAKGKLVIPFKSGPLSVAKNHLDKSDEISAKVKTNDKEISQQNNSTRLQIVEPKFSDPGV